VENPVGKVLNGVAGGAEGAVDRVGNGAAAYKDRKEEH